MPEPFPRDTPFPRLVTAGKWLLAGEAKWQMHGVSYGPFRSNSRDEPFPEDAQLQTDLQHIRQLGFNTLRLYELPTPAVIAAATQSGLRLLVGIPWTEHVDFLRSHTLKAQIQDRITEAVARLKDEPCVAGFLVGNEIEKTLVRWMGPSRVRQFLEHLIESARALAPAALFSYATYPSTEYLIPRNADFLAVNLYLEQPEALTAYLQRLQNLAGNKPLVITEFGLDTAANGESKQAEANQWFVQNCQQAAVAGTVWFSYTDEWHRGGEEVTAWKFGLVNARRQEKEICKLLKTPGHPRAATLPLRISVIVCTYNGTATLRACLESLGRLDYPDFEVLLIDDGSTLDIAAIAQDFPQVRYVRQEHAGLSVARNLGAALATGEILAYTDDDCIADEDWLTHLSLGFDDPLWIAAGGPNIPPLPRNRTEAVVAAAPGAPAHVLLTDIEAEHLPGCNLAIRKSALATIGGFRPQYRVAGDDVDVCWRLRETGGRLRFVPGAMVWHHRRYTVRAYFCQQAGYGRAEALLMKDHPDRFGPLGGARWFGGIYGDRAATTQLHEGSIYHGPLGQGLFQGIYSQGPRCWLDWLGGVLWVALFLLAAVLWQPLAAAAVVCLSLLLALCRLRTQTHAPFSLGASESLLLLGLCWWQPVVREWQRLKGMLSAKARPGRKALFSEAPPLHRPRKFSIPLEENAFWSESGLDRSHFLDQLKTDLEKRQIAFRDDDGWRLFDIEESPHHFFSKAYHTVTEYHGGQRCLTRVRAVLRVRALALCSLVAVFLCLSGGMIHFGMGFQIFLVFAVSSLLGLWLGKWSLRNKMTQVAMQAGLTPAHQR